MRAFWDFCQAEALLRPAEDWLEENEIEATPGVRDNQKRDSY